MTSIDSEPSIDSEAMSQQRPIKSPRGKDYAFSMPMQGFTATKQKTLDSCKGKEKQPYLIRWVELGRWKHKARWQLSLLRIWWTDVNWSAKTSDIGRGREDTATRWKPQTRMFTRFTAPHHHTTTKTQPHHHKSTTTPQNCDLDGAIRKETQQKKTSMKSYVFQHVPKTCSSISWVIEFLLRVV